MPKIYTVYQVDAFTTKKFTGNPAGVVPTADGLTESQMQLIARELNNSETAFILSPDKTDKRYHDVWIRYFTPTTEVPICGHATIAAHYVMAMDTKAGNSEVYQKTKAGIQKIEYLERGKDEYRIIMTQEKPEFESIIEGKNKGYLLSSLGLTNYDLYEKCPIQIVSTGHSKVMIGIKSRDKLNSLEPNLSSLIKLSKEIGCNGYFVFTLDSNERDILTHGRMFAPAIGINEDPVTGNANGPLGAYLVYYNLVKHDGSEFEFKAKQGTAINREGIVYVKVEIKDSKPVKVKIAGDAVIAVKGEIEI